MAFAINKFEYVLPEELGTAVAAMLEEWHIENKVFRLWSKDAALWSNNDEAKWLGWLDIVGVQLSSAEAFNEFQLEVKARGFSHLLLLGMGGSSLCPEVFSMTFGHQPGFPELHILDSTVPAQIAAVERKIDLAHTLFIVASKSGSTLEPNTFKQYFFERVSKIVGKENAGRQFVAITDPNSKMQKVAEGDGFWKIFFGKPEIGGRFSALSNFGMIPAAAMGLDVEEFLLRANEMVHACHPHPPAENAGAVLGAILGVGQLQGRDKLTVFTSPDIFDMGAWLEQLIAESTGKLGVSIIPIDREAIQPAAGYGNDRIFVYLRLENRIDEREEAAVAELENAGQPVIRITLPDAKNIGQEFFRWEFATAVAGSIMKINPFNQPDVEAAKIEARKITDEYEKTGSLPPEVPFFEADRIKLFSDDANIAALDAVVGEKTLANYLKAFVSVIRENDYFAVLGYIEMSAGNENLLQAIRHKVLHEKRVATCLGFGPRFLHSTGQGYKGGANNGVFLQITSDDVEDIRVPDQKYTFGVVKTAQSRGDFQVLLDRRRRALRVHLGSDVKKGLELLRELIDREI